MKNRTLLICAVLAVAIASSSKVPGQTAGRVVTVTTTNNVSPPAGSVSLLQALTGLQVGDTIQFNIPGAGPHYLVTPPGGYPVITKHNVTINGYTQPGSSPNTNSILAANNAKIDIVLDSRNGNSRLLDFAPTGPTDQTGYGDSESAVIGILEATNVTVRGVCIIATPLTGAGGDVAVYGVSFAKGASGHVNGCWIGVDLDGKSLFGPADAITGFRYRVRDANNAVLQDILVNNLVIGVKAGSQTPRSEFNVIAGVPAIPIIIEGNATRISGNFLNVLPDGLSDFNPPLADPVNFNGTFEGNIEIGRGGNSTLIGVDGDGVNDADERNVLSGVLPPSQGGYDHNIEFYGQTPGTNIVVAGNYIGVGVNGTTRFTNGVPVLNAAGGSAQFRFGSDFDGVSDALEGNVCYNNWPTDLFTTVGTEAFFDELSTGAIVSARGNAFVNNVSFPVSPLKTSGAGTFYDAYYTKALLDVTAGVLPVLLTNTTISKLVGTVPRGNTNYPVTIIDLYAVDPEGVTYGQTAGLPELPNGYVQGKAYAASFVEGSAADKNPAAGAFEFDLTGIELKGTQLTVTATYSKSPVGTRNAIALTSPFSAPVEVTYKPGSIESVGLRRIVADAPIINPGLDKLGNWEPNISVLGNSTFLLEGNTFADGTTDSQRYVVGLQPAAGGAMKLGEAFFADNGTPYKGVINLSRQNGNPGRVAGDKRPGAVNFIAGGEVSLHGFPQFTSDSRWTTNGIYSDVNRYAAIQTFSLDPVTLDQKSLVKAFDPVNGRNTAAFAGNAGEVSRFGGEVAALDNGNFVVVIDDRSNMIVPRRTATAAIITPTGQIVKGGFAIDGTIAVDTQIWSNVAAYQGGWCARFNGSLYFFDNAGNQTGKVDQNTSGESFDRGRGDGTRIAAHVNSPYVFLAGKVTTATTVKVAAWDARDRSFVAAADASEGAFPGTPDRVNLAVDALNRVVVSWESQPAGYAAAQVAARVLALNVTATNKTIRPLTSSFLAFVNEAQAGGIHTFRMSVAMTTKQICVAAKGEINLQNRPDQGANSPSELNFYTVISHPNPQDDPTPPVGGGGGASLTIARNGANITITWTADGFRLQSATAVTGPFSNVTTTGKSYTTQATANASFFRLISP